MRRTANRDEARTIRLGQDDVRASVRAGAGSGPPLVLCNGIGAPLEVLNPFVAALDPAVEVIRFDVPGVGGSPASRLPYTFPSLACLVGRLLDQLDRDRFDVLGISWGGALAQQLAFQNPHRCRRLVLAATATGSLMVPARPQVLMKMLTPRRYRDPAYIREVAGEIYGGRYREGADSAEQLLTGHGRPTSGKGYLFQLLAGVGWTSLPWLPLIRQPTLILAGDDDPIVPLVNARVMARLLPNAQLQVYQDGHLGLIDRADELAPVVANFVTAP